MATHSSGFSPSFHPPLLNFHWRSLFPCQFFICCVSSVLTWVLFSSLHAIPGQSQGHPCLQLLSKWWRLPKAFTTVQICLLSLILYPTLFYEPATQTQHVQSWTHFHANAHSLANSGLFRLFLFFEHFSPMLVKQEHQFPFFLPMSSIPVDSASQRSLRSSCLSVYNAINPRSGSRHLLSELLQWAYDDGAPKDTLTSL